MEFDHGHFCRLLENHYPQDDPSHDLEHLRRVVATCERLGRALGARMKLLLTAAYLHDVVNVPKNHPDRLQASAQAAAEASRILGDNQGYDSDEIHEIAQIILEHSYSANLKPTGLESAILQDADRLDAIGAVGLMRVFSCGTRMGSRFYHPEEPFPKNRVPDDRRYALDHFYAKLLRIPERLNTELARQEAVGRIRLLELFLDQLSREISGESLQF